MIVETQNKYEMRHRALLEAIRICGGVTAYSKSLKVSRSRASNWLNRTEIDIPYEYVILTEEITQVSVERLSPFTEASNKVIRKWRSKEKIQPINMIINNIVRGDHAYLKYPQEDRSIMIGTDKVLISGLMQLESYRRSNANKIPVKIIDLEALILEMRCLKEVSFNLVISEQVAVGLRIEQLIGNRQGQRNDLSNNLKGKISDHAPSLQRICNEVKDRGKMIAHITGFSSRDSYYRAKKVYLQGDLELINALDKNKISIAMAAQKIRDLKPCQPNKDIRSSTC